MLPLFRDGQKKGFNAIILSQYGERSTSGKSQFLPFRVQLRLLCALCEKKNHLKHEAGVDVVIGWVGIGFWPDRP